MNTKPPLASNIDAAAVGRTVSTSVPVCAHTGRLSRRRHGKSLRMARIRMMVQPFHLTAVVLRVLSIFPGIYSRQVELHERLLSSDRTGQTTPRT